MIADCSWDNPGADRYTGDVPAAIARYGLPVATQAELIRQWERRDWVDTVTIDRDSIRGRSGEYEPEIRDMHFGPGKVCHRVTRAKWDARHVETGIVLCADGECVLVPETCTNVSRITRRGDITSFLPQMNMHYDWNSPGIEYGGPIGLGPYLASAALPVGSSMAGVESWGGFAWLPGGFAGYAPIAVTGICECCSVGVPVAPVPEPEIAALLIGGIGAMVFWMRRRS